MLRRASIAELIQGGVVLRAEEAVAIAQQLIHRSLRGESETVHPPFGPPSAATVFIAADGSVTCDGCSTTLAVAEVAILLQELLPRGVFHVAGSLRYTVARALLDVDAPPFDSLEHFSSALARHERGDRAVIVRRLFARTAAPSVDRRRAQPAVASLRRQLRDADARVYSQQVAIDALTSMTSPYPAPARRGLALAAGIAIGLLMFGLGEAMHNGRQSAPVATSTVNVPDDTTPTVRPVAATAVPMAAPAEPMTPPSPIERTGTRIDSVERPEKHSVRAGSHVRTKAGERRARFGWLRTKFAIRADPL